MNHCNSNAIYSIHPLTFSSQLFFNLNLLGYVVRPSVFALRAANYSDGLKTVDAAGTDEPITIENPFAKAQRKCILCEHNITPNYKNPRMLSQFQSQFTGRIYGRHITGLCKPRQDQVEAEIKKAQHIGLMPTFHKAAEYFEDPKLFDPERPLRPHPH